jgi:phage terminase small subunit
MFIEEYLSNGFNVYQAYATAYPSAGVGSIKKNCYGLLNKPEIKAEIERRVQEIFEAKYISAERVIMELAEMAFAQKGDEIYNANVKVKALEVLAKKMGLLNGPVAPAKTTNETIEVNIVNDED